MTILSRWRWLLAAFVLLSALLAALVVAPWFRVANHPVRLELSAPPETRILVCWTRLEQNCLPFVSKGNSAIASEWLAELPARRIYDLWLRFPDGVRGAELRSLSVLNTNDVDRPLAVFQSHGGHVVLDFDANGALPLGEIGRTGFTSLAKDMVIIFTVVAGFLGGVILLIAALVHAGNWAPPPVEDARFPWSAFLLASLLHVLLVANSSVMMFADSVVYLELGYNLATHGGYGISGSDPWTQTVRTPGYPAFLSILFAHLGGTDLNVVAWIQAFLRMLAVGTVVWSLRRWLSAKAMGLAMIVGALEPVGYIMSRSMMSDGLATTFVLLAIAAYFESLGTTRRRRNLALGAFAGIATLGILVRATAAIVLVLPLLEFLSMALNAWRAGWATGLRRSAGGAVLLALIAAPTTGALTGWAFFNRTHFNYLGISSAREMLRFTAQVYSGSFDIRALEDRQLYDAYLIGRERYRYQYNVQFTSPVAARSIKNPGRYVEQLNHGLTRVVEASESLTPASIKFARFIRDLWWGMVFPDEKNYSGVSLHDWEFRFDDILNRVRTDEIARRLAQKIPTLKFKDHGTSSLVSVYIFFARHYDSTVLLLLFVLSAISAVVSLRFHGAVAAVPFIIYCSAVLAHAGMGLIYGRHLQCYDVLLMFQIIIGVSALWQRRKPPLISPGIPHT